MLFLSPVQLSRGRQFVEVKRNLLTSPLHLYFSIQENLKNKIYFPVDHHIFFFLITVAYWFQLFKEYITLYSGYLATQ